MTVPIDSRVPYAQDNPDDSIQFETLDEYEEHVHWLESTNQPIPDDLITEDELEQLKADKKERDAYYGISDVNSDTNTEKTKRAKAPSPPYGRWIVLSFSGEKEIDVVQLLCRLGFTSSTEVIPVVEVVGGNTYRHHVGILTPTGFERSFLDKQVPIELLKQFRSPAIDKKKSWNGVKKMLRTLARSRRLQQSILLSSLPKAPVPTPEQILSSSPKAPVPTPEQLLSTHLNATVPNVMHMRPKDFSREIQALKNEMTALRMDLFVLKAEMAVIVKDIATKLLASREVVALWEDKYKTLP